MQTQERPAAPDRGRMSQDEALRRLQNMRRTLLKFAADIDGIVQTLEPREGKEERPTIAR